MNDTVMERLGRYQIREIIGEGAMACVYKAFDPEINRPLAIKLLKAQLRLDGEYRNRFLREAKGAGVLSHPNIVTVFDVGEDQGHLLQGLYESTLPRGVNNDSMRSVVALASILPICRLLRLILASIYLGSSILL